MIFPKMYWYSDLPNKVSFANSYLYGVNQTLKWTRQDWGWGTCPSQLFPSPQSCFFKVVWVYVSLPPPSPPLLASFRQHSAAISAVCRDSFPEDVWCWCPLAALFYQQQSQRVGCYLCNLLLADNAAFQKKWDRYSTFTNRRSIRLCPKFSFCPLCK